jgi:hypothetical protein
VRITIVQFRRSPAASDVKTVVVVFILLMVTACEALQSDSNYDTISTPTVETIRDNIELTNLNTRNFPWLAWVAEGKLKRWDYVNDGPIPVKLNNNALAESAVDAIEAKLGKVIFDRTSIANTPDDLIVRGIIASEGTTVDSNGMVSRSACGNVSKAPGLTAYPPHFYDNTGKVNTKLYVNLSSPKCTATLDIAIHEFGHALGIGKHFVGFGIGNAIDVNFWNVLYNIYGNDIGTIKEDLIIKQVP